MFDLGGWHLTVIVNTILRSSLVYLAILVALRMVGKRHVAQLSIVDFVLVLLVSNAVQNAMVGPDTSLSGGLVAALTLIVINVLLTRLVFRSRKLGAFLEGEPTLLVRNGKILESHLAHEGIRREELEAAIREHGFESEQECRSAILEIDGSISVVAFGSGAREAHLPPLPHHHHRRAGRRGNRPGQ